MSIVDILPWRIQTFLGYRPKSVIHNLLGYYNEYSKPELGKEFLTVVHKGHVKKLILPNFTNERSTNHPNYIDNQTLTLNDIQFGGIRKARIFQKNFHPEIINSKNVLFNTFTNDLKRKIKHHQLLSEQNVGKAKHVNGKSFLLAATGAHNGYYHWLMDALTKFYVLEKYNISLDEFDYFIASGPTSRYKLETLKRFNIPEEKVVFIEEGQHLKTEYLMFVDTVRYHKEGTDFLKKAFDVDKIINRTKRIFISRAAAGFRNILEEDKLERFLSNYGFETVVLEHLSVADQAKIMAESEFIVSPHGAGLANIAFCHPKTVLFEIKPDEYANINYWFHSNCLDLEYYSYISLSKPNKDQIRPNTKDILFEKDLFPILEGLFEKHGINPVSD